MVKWLKLEKFTIAVFSDQDAAMQTLQTKHSLSMLAKLAHTVGRAIFEPKILVSATILQHKLVPSASLLIFAPPPFSAVSQNSHAL